MACLHSLIIPVTMSSPFSVPPPAKSDRHLPPCPVAGSARHGRYLILFLQYPPTNHKLQPTATAAVTAAVAAADYVLRPYCNRCQEDNIMVAIVLARSILIIVVNRSPASTKMGPRPSFSWHDGD